MTWSHLPSRKKKNGTAYGSKALLFFNFFFIFKVDNLLEKTTRYSLVNRFAFFVCAQNSSTWVSAFFTSILMALIVRCKFQAEVESVIHFPSECIWVKHEISLDWKLIITWNISPLKRSEYGYYKITEPIPPVHQAPRQLHRYPLNNAMMDGLKTTRWISLLRLHPFQFCAYGFQIIFAS